MIVVLLSVWVACGDYVLKLASMEKRVFANVWFLIGIMVYALSGFGWVYAMQHMKLALLGLVYSLVTILLLTAIGVLAYGETLNRYEMAGMALGVVAIGLLARFW